VPDEPVDVEQMLRTAREAREGRDRWRAVGPVLAALRAAGVTLARIEAETGIRESTASRLINLHAPA
jgi:hypothetical protein